MKLIFKDFDINFENIVFSKIKKNIIMDGNFNKILYSDTFVTINGLYILAPLILNYCSPCSEKSFFEPKHSFQRTTCENLNNELRDNFPANSFGRSPENWASPSLRSGESVSAFPEIPPAVYTEEEYYGMQYRKDASYLHFCSYTPHNLFIIKKISEIETRILNYYKSYYEIKKKIVLNITNLLNSGRIKLTVLAEEKPKMNSGEFSISYRSENVWRFSNFPANSFGRSPENWSSPSLRSGEALNLSSLRSDKLRGDFDLDSVTPLNFPSLRSGESINSPSLHSGEFSIAYRSENVRRFSNFSSERSEIEDQFSGERPKEFAGKLRLILKISGVWETKTEIGLSYKFIEIYEN
jgi:hypothetical protein